MVTSRAHAWRQHSGAWAWLIRAHVHVAASLLAGLLLAMPRLPAEPSHPPANLARGCPVTFAPTPSYTGTTDPGDATQLTDGVYTTMPFWIQKGMVGWEGVLQVTLELDLKEIKPISGISLNVAAGKPANVPWPRALLLLVSDDRKTWHFLGDLAAIGKPDAAASDEENRTARYATHALQAHGRYVQLVIIPARTFHYFFCDELEVYAGEQAWLTRIVFGRLVPDRDAFLRDWKTRRGVQDRLQDDLAAARADVIASALPAARKAAMQARLARAAAALDRLTIPDARKFRAIFPLCKAHARILSVYGPLMRARGVPPFLVWQKHRFDPLTLHETPAAPSPPSIDLTLLRQEHRAGALLLTNASEAPVDVTLQLKRLPPIKTPPWLELAACPWTDALRAGPVASALLPLTRRNDIYRLTIPAGLTQRIWLSVDASALPAGQYRGTLSITALGAATRVPVRVTVSRLTLQPSRLSLGMWDYANQSDMYGITAHNRIAAIRLMQSHGIDSPWGTWKVLPWPDADAFDAQHRLVKPLTFTNLDAWIAEWPRARHYLTFSYFGASFAGAPLGTPAFDARVGAWARALADHLKELGIGPRRLGMLIVDEPQTDEAARLVAAWGKAIKAAAPDILIFEDPAWPHPEQCLVQEALTLPDILCPYTPRYFDGGPASQQYFAQRRQAGQQLWFYHLSALPRCLDPHGFFRLHAWYAFRCGASGLGYWAFGDPGDSLNSWNEYAGSRPGYSPAYIDPWSVTDSLQWQAVREGLEDYELLAMLRDAAERSDNADEAGAAARLLEEALTAVLQQYPDTASWQLPATDRTVPDTWRVKIIAFLERAQRASGAAGRAMPDK